MKKKATYAIRERLAVTLAALIAIALPALAQIDPDDDDILDGQQYLIRSDDLVVADPAYISGSPDKTKVEYFPLETENMLITTSESVPATNLVSLECTSGSPTNKPFPQQTQTMRMFDLPNDVIVTLAPSKGVTGSGCENGTAGAMTFYVDDPGTGDSYEFTINDAINNNWLHTAVADFDNDGFDDLFILSHNGIYIATANDTENLSAGISIEPNGLSDYGSQATAMNDPTIGDFNADGHLDVAWMGTPFSDGNSPSVKFVTVCAGPANQNVGTLCDDEDAFRILSSSATISPQPTDSSGASIGSTVTVGGKCTQTDSNQVDGELRAPAMAVAAGQYDTTTVGDELAVVYLYEHDSNHHCHVMAEVYSFTKFIAEGSTGKTLTPKFENNADNIAPHDHIGNPAAIYAQAGNLTWFADDGGIPPDQVPVAISGGENHTVLVISFAANLAMAVEKHKFSTNHDKSFAGLAIGRFSSPPSSSTTSCSLDTDCSDTCSNNACSISGWSCQTDSDCQGTCTSQQVCSYAVPSSYDQQIAAFLMAHSSSHDSNVYIFTAEEKDVYEPQKVQEFVVENFLQTATNRGVRAGSLLRAGDLEGRSQRLGAPTVLTITKNIQPDVILSAPPTHADWLPFGNLGQDEYFCAGDCPNNFSADNPCNCTDLASNSTCSDGSEVRCLTNFSVLSGTYLSQYEFDESDTKQSSKTDTTSWSLGASLDVSEKTRSITPSGNEFTQKVELTASGTYSHSVATTHNHYRSQAFDASTSTGFFDHVWASTRDYNVYYYPVIGQTVCVDSCEDDGGSYACSISGGACVDDADCPDTGVASCDADDEQQLYVQYDGATQVSIDDYDASGLEWYQPVHEPGQILSYPWDCDQLAARYGVNICDSSAEPYTLLSDGATFSTDTSTQTVYNDWSAGKGKSVTTGKSGSFSQGLSETMTYGTNNLEKDTTGGFQLKEQISVNANEAISTSVTNSSSLGESTGISIDHPGTFLNPTSFAYDVDNYIFGDAPNPGQLQQIQPSSSSFDTNGVMRSAYTTIVRDDDGVGSWWTSGVYNNYIDLALNRPMHLVPAPGKGASGEVNLTNCLPVSFQTAVTDDCIEYVLPDPSPLGLWSSQFYWLRGFFITPADAIGQGPQLYSAQVGDILGLQVRSYNYSLADMDDDSSVKVDFYAQQWDPYCNAPRGYYDHTLSCSQTGGAVVSCGANGGNPCASCCITDDSVDSIWIGQDVLEPLPGFDSQSPSYTGVPNWALATTTFDTGDPTVCGSDGCGGNWYLFWVVAWPEGTDINGNPVLFDELPDHSLTGIPPVLTAIGDICPLDNDCNNGACRATGTACSADADCETAADNTCGPHGACAVSGVDCSTDADCGDCLCEACMGRFSNNIGFYHVAFAITDETTGTEMPAESAPEVVDKVSLVRVNVTPESAKLGEQVVVRAGLRAVDAPVKGLAVHFYAVPHDLLPLPTTLSPEHPKVEEVFERFTPFDQEILPRLRAGHEHEAQVPFHPQALGTYRFLVSGILDGEERLLGDVELEVVEPATVLVCHKGREIYVDQKAVAAHLAHGDNEGACD